MLQLVTNPQFPLLLKLHCSDYRVTVGGRLTSHTSINGPDIVKPNPPHLHRAAAAPTLERPSPGTRCLGPSTSTSSHAITYAMLCVNNHLPCRAAHLDVAPSRRPPPHVVAPKTRPNPCSCSSKHLAVQHAGASAKHLLLPSL